MRDETDGKYRQGEGKTHMTTDSDIVQNAAEGYNITKK